MKRVILIAMGCTLAGCAAQAPMPSDRFYRFADLAPSAARRETPLMEHLAVEELRGSGLYAERPLVYSTDEGGRRLEQYHYDYWLEAPPRLLQGHLIAYFQAAGLAAQVSRPEAGPVEEAVVGGHIDCFEKHITAAPRVVVCLELYLKRPGNDGPLLAKRYDASVPVNGDGMEADLKAYEEGLDRVLTAFVGDISRIEGRAGAPEGLTAAEQGPSVGAQTWLDGQGHGPRITGSDPEQREEQDPALTYSPGHDRLDYDSDRQAVQSP